MVKLHYLPPYLIDDWEHVIFEAEMILTHNKEKTQRPTISNRVYYTIYYRR